MNFYPVHDWKANVNKGTKSAKLPKKWVGTWKLPLNMNAEKYFRKKIFQEKLMWNTAKQTEWNPGMWCSWNKKNTYFIGQEKLISKKKHISVNFKSI